GEARRSRARTTDPLDGRDGRQPAAGDQHRLVPAPYWAAGLAGRVNGAPVRGLGGCTNLAQLAVVGARSLDATTGRVRGAACHAGRVWRDACVRGRGTARSGRIHGSIATEASASKMAGPAVL